MVQNVAAIHDYLLSESGGGWRDISNPMVLIAHIELVVGWSVAGGIPDLSGDIWENRDNLTSGFYQCPDEPPPPPPGGPPGGGGPGGGGAGGGSGAATSQDPNEKFAVSGFGPENWIRGDALIPYRINFENLGLSSRDADGNPYTEYATAPAQRVTITDQLEADLDWSTLRLTEMGFGDTLVSIPAESTYFSDTVSMTYNGKTFNVELEAGINVATGRVFATFQSIDPNTSLPPDVLTGFLPPEDGTGCGMGHLAYTISLRADLASGTEIRNVALISFDGQTLIATNQIDPHDASAGTDPIKEALTTIDSGAPTSQVTDLPGVSPTTFIVDWTGQDDDGGSGMAVLDVFVSTDEGAWELWLDDTAETSAEFTGEFGHTYAFCSVATDYVGHVELPPAMADTSTTVEVAVPEAIDDDYQATENESLVVLPMEGVLANDEGGMLHTILVQTTVHGALVLREDGSFDYTPDENFNREDSFQYRGSNGVNESAVATVTITVQTAHAWFNGVKPLDVNDDTYISPIDALLTINELNRNSTYRLPAERARPLTKPFYDVNYDGYISPIDALLVINYLNRGGGEGEADGMAAGETGAMTGWSPDAKTDSQVGTTKANRTQRLRGVTADDPPQSANVLQSLDLVFAKLDDDHRTKTRESSLRHRRMNAGDLEEFLEGMLGRSANEEELLPH